MEAMKASPDSLSLISFYASGQQGGIQDEKTRKETEMRSCSSLAYLSIQSDEESPEEELNWELTIPREVEPESPKGHRRHSKPKRNGNDEGKEEGDVKPKIHVYRSRSEAHLAAMDDPARLSLPQLAEAKHASAFKDAFDDQVATRMAEGRKQKVATRTKIPARTGHKYHANSFINEGVEEFMSICKISYGSAGRDYKNVLMNNRSFRKEAMEGHKLNEDSREADPYLRAFREQELKLEQIRLDVKVKPKVNLPKWSMGREKKQEGFLQNIFSRNKYLSRMRSKMPIREVPQTVWERASGVPGLLAKPISLRKSKLSEEFSAPYDSDSATSEEEEEDQKEEEMYALEIEVNPINGEGMPLLVNSRSDRVLHQPAAAQRNQGRERREIVPKRHAA